MLKIFILLTLCVFKPVDQDIKVILGPCIDDTDFKAREELLTYNQAGMEIDVILEKHDGTVTTTAVTPTTSGVHDWAHTDQGYYEFEPVKQTKEDSSWLDTCQGKVVKMVSLLLYDLPPDRKYKVVFMKRKMEEILASQKKMLIRRGREAEIKDDEEMAAEYMLHLRKLYDWFKGQNHLDILFISYNDMLTQPGKQAKKLKRFLNRNLKIKNMVGVVDKTLYRQRT